MEGGWGSVRAAETSALTVQLCGFWLIPNPVFVCICKDGSVSMLVYSSAIRTKYNHIFKAHTIPLIPSPPFLPKVRLSCSVSLKIPLVFIVNAEKPGVSSFGSKDELTLN